MGKLKVIFMGQGSLRFVTPENKVIYVDPYAGKNYDSAADLILVTHAHFDHCQTDKIKKRAEGCKIITQNEALEGGTHQTFELGFVTVEAVEAGNNKNHSIKECVGYLLTFTDETTVYISGDTSKTKQMESLAKRRIDYAFYCCDGVYNMGMDEAAECAAIVGAKHDIPYHNAPGNIITHFNKKSALKFKSDNLLVLDPGKEYEL
ncbi:MAG: MBL fold metallo-hydrolase [Eubacterium sp.]|nr:MBL fold metallo-hydrolase [Eubacterium sp.]